jgi:hypothetical protein
MLKGFFDEVRDDFRKNKVDLIYGTVRLIERDNESFLPWAKQASVCVHDLQLAYCPQSGGAETVSGCLPEAHRHGGAAWRLLLPHLSSVRYSKAGRKLLPSIPGISPVEEEV